MSKVIGTVDRIKQHGRAYNLQVNGEWYGFGFNQPDFEEGTEVEFDIKMRGRYANVDTSTFKVVGQGSGKPSGHASGKSPSRDVQGSINWQSARNAAIEIVKVGVEAGAVSVGTAKAKKLDNILALVDNLTERFYFDTDAVAQGDIESVIGQKAESTDDELDDEDDG